MAGEHNGEKGVTENMPAWPFAPRTVMRVGEAVEQWEANCRIHARLIGFLTALRRR